MEFGMYKQDQKFVTADGGSFLFPMQIFIKADDFFLKSNTLHGYMSLLRDEPDEFMVGEWREVLASYVDESALAWSALVAESEPIKDGVVDLSAIRRLASIMISDHDSEQELLKSVGANLVDDDFDGEYPEFDELTSADFEELFLRESVMNTLGLDSAASYMKSYRQYLNEQVIKFADAIEKKH